MLAPKVRAWFAKTETPTVPERKTPFDPLVQADPPREMVWIPGGTFRMGTTDKHPHFADAPGHEVEVDGFLARRDGGDERPVRGLREGDGVRHGRGAEADPGVDPSGTATRRTGPVAGSTCSRFPGVLAAAGSSSEPSQSLVEVDCPAHAGSTPRGRAATSRTG